MKKLLTLLMLAGLSLAAVAYVLKTRQQRGGEETPYVLAAVEYGAVSEVVSATGLVRPREVYIVGSDLSGKVVAVLADYNQTVREGEVLLRLDDRMARQRRQQAQIAVEVARAGVKQAQARRNAARQAYDRENGRGEQTRRQEDVDLAEAQLRAAEVGVEVARIQVRQAEQALKQAELGLRLTVVRAPILGESLHDTSPPGTGTVLEEGKETGKRSFMVLDRRVSVNQEIAPPLTGNLFSLARGLERMQVVTQVAEGDVARIRPGLKAHFTVSGSGDTEPSFDGTVEDVRLVPVSEHGAVFYQVVIDTLNRRDEETGLWQLRPGLTASVDVIRRRHDPVWKVPTAALALEVPAERQTEAVRARLAEHQARPDHGLWRTAWVIGPDRKPWPIFLRTEGKTARGEPPIRDDKFTEVLEWAPDLQPQPSPGDPASYPRVITDVPAAKKKGLFTMPNIKF